MNEYTHIDLFSGLGCWLLAARANGIRTVALCEREEWLAQGLERTYQVPCYREVKTFPAEQYRGVWLLTGSPPCQPVSCAGKRRGKSDDRWLWGPTLSVCEVARPAWVCLENPPGIDGLGLEGILAELERIGYEVQALRIPACAVNSAQDRDRFWIMGHANQLNGWTGTGWQDWTQALDHAETEWLEFRGKLYRVPVGLHELANETAAQIPKRFRSKFISALGNAIVWPIAARLIHAMKQADE